MREFQEWVRKATDKELGEWLAGTSSAKYAYQDEIPVVEAEIERRKQEVRDE